MSPYPSRIWCPAWCIELNTTMPMLSCHIMRKLPEEKTRRYVSSLEIKDRLSVQYTAEEERVENGDIWYQCKTHERPKSTQTQLNRSYGTHESPSCHEKSELDNWSPRTRNVQHHSKDCSMNTRKGWGAIETRPILISSSFNIWLAECSTCLARSRVWVFGNYSRDSIINV